MALAISVNFTVRDAKGKSATTKVHVPTGFSIPQYVEFATAFGQLICDLCDGELTDVSISIPLSLSGATIRAAANATADVAKKMLMIARGAIAGLFARFTLPTYDEAHTLTATDAVDMADADVVAMVAILETGVGGITPVDLRDNDLTDVLSARETFLRFN
jgi:hypothetical protein